MLEPTTGKRCRNVLFPTLPKHACMTCCQTKVFGFIATFYKLMQLISLDLFTIGRVTTFIKRFVTTFIASLYLRSFVFRLVWGFFAKLCHVQCNDLSLDYCALMCCHLQQICWKYQNHLYENFYCLAFSTSCSREQRNLKRMERLTKNSCLLKELALQTHTRQGIFMQSFQMYFPINNDGMVGQSREFGY